MQRIAPLMLVGLIGCTSPGPVSVDSTKESRALAPLTIGEHTFERRQLENGLRVAAIQDAGESMTVFLSVAAGNRNETATTTGLAHLTEHAMFAGTDHTDTDMHEKTVVAWGGESNAYTRDDYTMYYDHSFPPSELETVLAMEADRLRNLHMKSAPVLHERHRLELEEAHSYRTSEGRAEQLEAAVYGLHPYRYGLRTEAGHTRGPGLSVDQVREFYDRHYHPNRVAIVVVGPVDPQVALDAVEEAFRLLPTGPAAPIISMEPVPTHPRTVSLRSGLSTDRHVRVWLTPAYGQAPRAELDLVASLLSRAELPSGTPLTISIGGRIDRDLLQVGWSGGPEVEAEVDVLLASLRDGSYFDDEAHVEALEEIQGLLADAHAEQPLRARPYFAKAATFAAFESLGFAEAYATYGRDLQDLSAHDLVAAARQWMDPETCTTVVFLGTGVEEAPLPEDVEGLQEAAMQAAETGNFDRAIAAYGKLLEMGPNRMNTVIFYYERGALLLEQKNFDDAIADFEAALKVVDYPAVREILEEAHARKARAMRGDFGDE
ncbi:MAG: insulinase family protein [Planctomycetota bacterium]